LRTRFEPASASLQPKRFRAGQSSSKHSGDVSPNHERQKNDAFKKIEDAREVAMSIPSLSLSAAPAGASQEIA
jgi:hypothetical protein